MSFPEQDKALRRSFRCRVPESQQEAVLRARDWRFAVRLLNESVEGAAVQLDRDPGVEIDDVVRLTTTLGSFEARVAHVSRIQPAETAAGPAKPLFRLGLERLQHPQVPPVETAESRTTGAPREV